MYCQLVIGILCNANDQLAVRFNFRFTFVCKMNKNRYFCLKFNKKMTATAAFAVETAPIIHLPPVVTETVLAETPPVMVAPTMSIEDIKPAKSALSAFQSITIFSTAEPEYPPVLDAPQNAPSCTTVNNIHQSSHSPHRSKCADMSAF